MISTSQMGTVRTILRGIADGKIANEISIDCGITYSHLTRLIPRMVEMNLVTREKRDGRTYALRLTSTGRALLRALDKALGGKA